MLSVYVEEAENELLRAESIDVLYNMFRFGFIAGYLQTVEDITHPTTTNEDGTAIYNYKADILKQLDHLTQQQRRCLSIVASGIAKANDKEPVNM